MTRGARQILVVAMAMIVVCGLTAPSLAAARSGMTSVRASLSGRGHYTHRGRYGEVDVNVCASSAAGVAHCDAHIRTDLFGKHVEPLRRVPNAPGAPADHALLGNQGAYDPAYLQSAYNAPSATNGAGQIVAVVDAFDAPNVEGDLAAYRSRFGLPACTTGNGCFTKINQNGGTTYPAANVGWAREISLDVQMVSAMCPRCQILLVEATTNSLTDLGIAVNRAVALGADVVSNSYGSNEFSIEAQADTAYYDHPGVAIVASSGDEGYGVSYPAASPNVVAVGGTSLYQSTDTGTRNATETAWSGAGSGCSAYEPKPEWQTDSGCIRRTVADVSAVADPSTGVWVYVSTDGGWEVFGGTSVSAPIVGAMYALAGNGASSVAMSSLPYATPAALNDVVSGSNGNCGGTYLCTGTAGYDGPTGLGTPNTAAAFADGGSTATPPPAPLPDPDFSLTASALGASMRPLQSATSTVTVTPENDFTGNVGLSAVVSPNPGLSTSFSSQPVAVGAGASSSTLTFTAHRGGTYAVTITATQGALVHTVDLTVTVNDFSMQVSPAKASVARGKQVGYTVKLTPEGAFNGTVKLSISGLPSRDTVMFTHNPAAATSSQTVMIKTSTKDARGTLSLRFIAVSGALNHRVTAVLSVQ